MAATYLRCDTMKVPFKVLLPYTPWRRVVRAVAQMATVILLGGNLAAQTLQEPRLTSPAPESATADRGTGLDEASPFADVSHVSLSAARIISILQENPQVMVELKALLPEAQQQGSQVQPDEVTDEMVYSQISSSKEVRQNITVFLRARGYISDADFQNDLSEAGNGVDRRTSSLMQSQVPVSG